MRLTLATVLAACGGDVVRINRDGSTDTALGAADLETPISGAAIDSRAAAPRSLFIALRGERVDGHDFVGDAFARGASAALVYRIPTGTAIPGDEYRYLVVVPDPLTALQSLAAHWRRGHDIPVIGITGSIGKTTTKEIVWGVLASRGPVLKSLANLNTEIGLPLMLLGLGHEHWAAVLEMGMYAAGDIALLTEIARPQIGIVTTVAPIHLERLGSIEAIARAKSELVAGLDAGALALLNGDDEWTRAMAVTSGVADACLVGLAEDCEYRAVHLATRGLDGLSFIVEAEGTQVPFDTHVPGRHTIHAFLFAIAAGRRLGMDWPELQDAVAAVRLDERQRRIEIGRLLLLDDSYNAAPMSVRAALELLREAPGTKIAVLGDMLELGPHEEMAHRELAQSVVATADWLVTRGTRSRWIAEESAKVGMSPERVVSVEDNPSAVHAVREILASVEGPVSVLVKGSRGMAMEEVVRELQREPSPCTV